MKKVIVFSLIAVITVTAAGFSQIIISTRDVPADCGGCGGGDRVCCANTTLNFG
jgi:hypothetical protein